MSQFNKGYFQKYAGHTSGASFAKKLRYFQLGVAKHIKFFHIAFHYIQNLPYGAKVLDIGCGNGVLLHDIHDMRLSEAILAILFPVFGLLNIVSSRFESLCLGGVHFLIDSGIYGVYKKNTSNK